MGRRGPEKRPAVCAKGGSEALGAPPMSSTKGKRKSASPQPRKKVTKKSWEEIQAGGKRKENDGIQTGRRGRTVSL